ncbi:MAG: autotransporter outer membrane beta-barrel domain-containing protein [Puniceicoccales bacterium]|nr:autotransporter outer membrane beta-barrel domain-containing protein [Puniceicoccales bacterium]
MLIFALLLFPAGAHARDSFTVYLDDRAPDGNYTVDGSSYYVDVGGNNYISSYGSFCIAVNLGSGGSAPGKSLVLTSQQATMYDYPHIRHYVKGSNSSYCTFDFNGISGTESDPFSVRLTGTNPYFFTNDIHDSGRWYMGFGCGNKDVGLGVAHLGDGIGSPNFIHFSSNGGTKWLLCGLTSGDYYSATWTSLFGAAYALQTDNGLAHWQFDPFGNGNNLRANAAMTTTLFGAGYLDLCAGLANGWSIAGFGDSNYLATIAKDTGSTEQVKGIYHYSGSAVLFGGAYASSSPTSFCNWTIGPSADVAEWAFGGDNTLSATADWSRTGDDILHVHANLFGAGYNYESDDSFCDWTIGSFGQTDAGIGNSLVATANGTNFDSSSKGSYAEANLFGAACNFSSENAFLRWTIGNFLGDQSLTTSATAAENGASIPYVHANLFGAGYNYESDDSFCDWTIGNFENNNKLISVAKFTNSGSSNHTYAEANLFGAACNHRSSRAFCNWSIGDIGDGNALLACACDSSGGTPPFTHANLFGAGCNFCSPNSFCNWTLGDAGENNTYATAVSNYSRETFNITYANIFGAACSYGGKEFLPTNTVGPGQAPWDVLCSHAFCNWTIGTFGDGTAIGTSAYAYGYDNSNLFSTQIRASLFGAAYNVYGPESFCNWTVEFQGNATMAAFGADGGSNGGVNIFLAALGGDGNGSTAHFYDGMRFYFNDFGAGDPSVVIAAAKLSGNGWTVNTTSEPYVASAATYADQEGNQMRSYVVAQGIFPRAVALGPNFQLNVGRRRILDANWSVDRAAGPNSASCSNGTWETDASIRSGGTVDGVGPGTLHLLGAIAKARMVDGTDGSTLRIDGGWSVKCYAPVQDLHRIVIHDGTLEIKSSQDSDFEAAIGQLAENVAYVDPSNGKLYQGTASSQRDGRDGVVSLDFSNYPVSGRLTINADRGEAIRFGLREMDGVYAGTGSLLLTGNPATPKQQLLLTGSGSAPVFGVALDVDTVPDPAIPIDCHAVHMPEAVDATAMHNLLGGISRGQQITGTDYYWLDGDQSSELVLRAVSPYVAVNNLYLLWSEEEGRQGLVLMTLANGEAADGAFVAEDSSENEGDGDGGGGGDSLQPAPPQWLPTDYARSFVGGELAQLGAEVHWALGRAVAGHLAGQRCQKDPFFLLGIHSRIRRTTVDDFGYRGTIDGGILGWDAATSLTERSMLRCGIYAAHAHATMRCFGAASALGRKIRQNYWTGATFLSLEHRSATRLKGNFSITVGGSHVVNRAGRVDGEGNFFSARFSGSSTFYSVEGSHGLLRCGNFQIGPWAVLHYDWQRQDAYAETSTVASGAASLGKLNHSIGSILLGIGLERETMVCGGREAEVFAKIGWHCQARRHHSDAFATIDGTPLGGFLPPQNYGAHTSGLISLGIHGRFGRHWSASAHWYGEFANGKTDNHTNVQLCHAF